MTTSSKILLSLLVLLASVVGSARATTIGFVGAASVNADLPVNYGTNIATDGTGWTVSDGTGATPNVDVYWGGTPDSTGWDWEFHNAGTFQHIEPLNSGGAWDAPNPPFTNAVAQLQSQSGAPHEIKFSVPAGVAFTLNSFDIGNATDQTPSEGPYGFDIELIKDSTSSPVWSHSTPLWDEEEVPRVLREESVSVNYTGDPGEAYTLRFTRTPEPGITWRSGLDNLSFSEGAVADPLKLVVSTTTGLVELKNTSGQSYTIDSYEITSDSDSLDPLGWTSLQDSDYEGNGAPGTGNGWEEAGGVNIGQLIESYLDGSTTIADGTSILLGQAFNFDKIDVQQDLLFGYHVAGEGGALNTGDVEYISPVIDADFDNDGDIDGNDFLTWQRNVGLTGSATNAQGDADGDMDVDGADLVAWKATYGTTPLVAASAAVPEPTTACLLVLAGCGWFLGARRRSDMATSLPGRPTWLAGLVAAGCVALITQSAIAGKTNDRGYEFGDGGTNTLQDSVSVNSDDKQDLSVSSGSPTFVNVSSTGLNRPGAATGDTGAQFNGTNDVLSGVALNLPNETVGPTPVPGNLFSPILLSYPFNYDTISTRGVQLWVYPDASAVGTEQSPTARQDIVFDSRGAGGVSISADGKWTQTFASVQVDGLLGGTVPVVGDQWYHVMQHIYHFSQPGFPAPQPTSSGRSYTGVVYVNGVAVSASNGSLFACQLWGGCGIPSYVGELVVGAGEVADDGITPLYDNHFKGVVDDLEMYVYGDNSSETGPPAGQDYGTFDLFSDNAWIADQIAAIPGGVLKSGDVNRDGSVDDSDVTAFVAGWKKEKKFQGAIALAGVTLEMHVGDWETWGWGDLNLDGQVNLTDAIILDQSLITEGFTAGLNFDLLGAAVPEPASWTMGLLAALFVTSRRRRRT